MEEHPIKGRRTREKVSAESTEILRRFSSGRGEEEDEEEEREAEAASAPAKHRKVLSLQVPR